MTVSLRGLLAGRASMASVAMLLSGCATYIHDPALDATTAKASATYDAAAPLTSMQSIVDAQLKQDEAEVAAIQGNERDVRRRMFATLMVGRGEADTGLARLKETVDLELAWLVDDPSFDLSSLLNFTERRLQVRSTLTLRERQVEVLARRYRGAGGTFEDCSETEVDRLRAEASELANKLSLACRPVVGSRRTLRALDDDFARAAGGGDLKVTSKELKAVRDELAKQITEKSAAEVRLNRAKKDLDDLQKRESSAKEVADALAKVKAEFTKLEGEADVRGGAARTTGKALALIEFNKTNLRDALLAGDGDGDGDSHAVIAKRELAALGAGLLDLKRAQEGPTVADLSLALAAQTGLSATIAARLEALGARKDLLEERMAALTLEAEHLARAKVAIEKAIAVKDPDCDLQGLASLLRTSACDADVRSWTAESLTAFNTSWAAGRTPARVAFVRVSHQIAWLKLRTQQETLKTRVATQTIAVRQLAAAGAAGQRPEAIAGLLNAIGLGAVSWGVN
jgi:hypothetical protein